MSKRVLCGTVGTFATEYRLYRQAQTLQIAGYAVLAAGFSDPRRTSALSHWDGIPLILLPVSRSQLPGALFFLCFMFRMFRLARRERPEILYACDLPVLFPFALAKMIQGGRLYYDSREIFTELAAVHDRPLKKLLWGLLERFAVRHADKSLAVCESDRDFLRSRYPALAPAVVRNLPRFAAHQKSDLLRMRLSIPEGVPVILFQGTFLESGGTVELTRAAALFTAGRLVLVGDGPQRPACEAVIRELGLKDRVFILPPVPFTELHFLTCSADIGCYTGKGDGLNLINVLPNKVFEYAMAGLPMVLSDLPELRKINERHRVGLLLDEVSPKAIAQAVNRLLSDPAAFLRCRENALSMARELCWENEEKIFLNWFNS